MADIQDSFKAVFSKIENYQKYQDFKEKKVEQLNKKGVAFEQKASNIKKPLGEW
jgi:endonuclease III